MRFVEHTLFSAVALTTNGGTATSPYIRVFGAPFVIIHLWDSAASTAKVLATGNCVDIYTTVQGLASIASATGIARHTYGYPGSGTHTAANIRTGLALIVGGIGYGDGSMGYPIVPTCLPFDTLAVKVTSDTSTNTMTLNGKMYVASNDSLLRDVATV